VSLIADVFHLTQPVADPVIALGHEMNEAVLRAADDPMIPFSEWCSITDRIGAAAERILQAEASTLIGAAIQVRALHELEYRLANHAPEAATLFTAALHSIVAVLDREAGLTREQFGGDYFLAKRCNPHRRA
jgi:hypothetical protein